MIMGVSWWEELEVTGHAVSPSGSREQQNAVLSWLSPVLSCSSLSNSITYVRVSLPLSLNPI